MLSPQKLPVSVDVNKGRFGEERDCFMKKQERVERFQLRNPKDPTRKYFTVSEYRETFFPERMSARGLLQRKIEEMNLAEKGSELEKR